MHLSEYLKNFLYDKNYFITFYNNSLYVFNFVKINKISKLVINLEFLEFNLSIKGLNLYIKKMNKSELVIKGTITSMEINNE